MKDTILVNLVSEQTIPNVQFIKWYFNQNHLPMKILLLSTREMEQKEKSKCIKSALSLPETFVEWETILTDENDISKTQNILKDCLANQKYKNVIVNITGGTKLMSLAVFDFFNGKPNMICLKFCRWKNI